MLRESLFFSATKIDKFTVIRDDLLPGGTKRRALVKWLPSLNSNHFVYAGSVYGSGGWALAEACKDLGYTCTLALSKAAYRPGWLDQIDCEVEWFEPQPVEHIQNNIKERKTVLPLGFNDTDFKSSLTEVFRELELEIKPTEIWMPCVSGVLLSAAQQAWPDTRINAVCVARNHGYIGNAIKYEALEKYYQPAREPPPYPANPFSDAKLWHFIRQFGLKDALIWNTSI